MVDCFTYGLPYLTTLGEACAVSNGRGISSGSSSKSLAAYAGMLEAGFLQPSVSDAARGQLRAIAAFSIASSSIAVAFWGVRAYRQVKGTRQTGWLLKTRAGPWGVALLPDPTLAWSVPMMLATTLLAVWCTIVHGSAPASSRGSTAYGGLISMLFCLAVWLSFPGAVYNCLRLRFGKLSRSVTLLVWGIAIAIVLSLAISTSILSVRWDETYDDAMTLVAALKRVSNDATGTATASVSRANEDYLMSLELALEALDVRAALTLVWLFLTALFYLPLAVTAIVRPRSRPPTPGLGLDFGLQHHRLSIGLASLAPSRRGSLLQEMVTDLDSDVPPSFTRAARWRMAAHLVASLVYGGIVCSSVALVLFGQPVQGAPSADPDWIWRGVILPGWTHAIGSLLINIFLLAGALVERPSSYAELPATVCLAPPPKRSKVDEQAPIQFAISFPTKSDIQLEIDDMQEHPMTYAPVPPPLRSTPKRRKPSRDVVVMEMTGTAF